MTAINPNTTIYAINVPLDPFSEDTILFSSLDQQRQYFYDRKVTILTNYTYQREHRNWLKVTDPNGLMDKCNYLMFVNESYENKRMYAWITNINWVNNETCEIEYEMDYVQTFLFDIYNRAASANHLPTTWVERQHAYTDGIGDNIQPENIALGEYENNSSYTKYISLKDGCVILGVANQDGRVYDGIYSGVEMYCYYMDSTHTGDLLDLRTMLNSHTQQNDILFAYMVPTAIIDAAYTVDSSHRIVGKNSSQSSTAFPNPRPLSPLSSSATLNGYTPKNKKLLTYPYNFFIISDGNGNTMNIRYEFCQSLTPMLKFEFAVTPSSLIKLYPYNYKNSGTNTTYKEECITITGFPMVSWAYDAFQQWVSRSLTSQLIKVGATAVGAAVAYAVGMPAAGALVPISAAGANGPYGRDLTAQNKYKTQAKQAGIVAGASSVGSLLSQAYAASIEGDISNGTFTNSGSDFATGSCGIYTARLSVNAQNAETIDNYFTLYGYAQNKLMQPNLEARMYYTYVKTTNININGAMPIEAKTQIANRFNSGIRFWRDYTHFLDYTVNNSPRG